jgi:hypothetical protein
MKMQNKKMQEVKSSKSSDSATNLGLVSKDTLDYKIIRGETGESTQRPEHSESSEKTDRGTFQFKG